VSQNGSNKFEFELSEKLLLIHCWTGPGGAGKSTLLRQMRVIYAEGFFHSEREDVREVIFSNVMVALKIIAEERRELGLHYQNDSSYVSLLEEVEEDYTNLKCCRGTNER